MMLYAIGIPVLGIAGWLWRRWHKAKAKWAKRSAGQRNIAFTVMGAR